MLDLSHDPAGINKGTWGLISCHLISLPSSHKQEVQEPKEKHRYLTEQCVFHQFPENFPREKPKTVFIKKSLLLPNILS